MRLLVLSLALLVSLFAAQAQDPIAQGRKIAREFCASCHATEKTVACPRIEAPPFRTLSRNFNLDQIPEKLEQGFSSNHPDMPEFKFNEEEARAMRAYLRTIQE